jgi:hypothetical protein
MDGLIEEKQQQRDPKVEENDNESIDFVRIDQSEKDKSDQETQTSKQEEDHHLVEGGEQQERNLTDWSFDGTMDSSAGGQSVAAGAELVTWRMAALTVYQFKFCTKLEMF